MPLRKIAISQAQFERSPDQDADIFTADMIGHDEGAPVTIGFGRYGPHQELNEIMLVDDVMMVIAGHLTVAGANGSVTAGPGEVVHMPKGERIQIRSHEHGATTAYVTYPHWKDAR